MQINRFIKTALLNDLLHSGKIILLYGPRQAGKTTLSKEIIAASGLRTLLVNADQSKYIDILSGRDLTKLQSLVHGYDLLVIDEAQRIPEIGINLKIIHDEIPGLKLLVTGSSSFLISGRVSESLAGRKRIYTLLPVSVQELSDSYNPFELNGRLEERLLFGSYPEVITTINNAEKEEYLRDITSSLIFKDILELEQVKYPVKIRELLKLLAFQIGSQVSLNELGQQLGLNRETVERYLWLLEQSFIIFRLSAFSRNPRKEISKSQKYFFYDNGIRNIMIDDLRSLKNRNDTGALWENYIIAERRKYLLFNRIPNQGFFWRTYSGTELDYIEESQDGLFSYEIKFSKTKIGAPLSWTQSYGSNFQVVNRDNYLEFIT